MEDKRYDYTSDRNFQIIRKLTAKDVKGDSKKVERNIPTWTTEENFIVFKKGKPTSLSEEDLQLPTIKKLISSGIIKRYY